ncbi:biosynthetic peptidoglycan transglycosylase [Geobacter sp. DSM 9736]|uniref:biosynthetic peptidoglycan transglycosylase n=1 Tax=Geobacter sp. DSM 9736 TaxID=1277350 RepID=UPI000B5138AD|nr:biosynthetic peptidoglycan transglycosylase [Geobacter sp. DSM 9736]SNB46108.1 Transglycosylase [Geobacter sp. DSM 9736]
MGPLARPSLLRILPFLAIALLSGALAACAAFEDLRNRASLLAGSLTGFKCLVASVGPCFPCGIKASDITMCSTSGIPLFQAKELRTQVNLLRYLHGNTRPGDLFDTLYGDQVKLTLLRNERGEWEFPRIPTPQRIRSSGQEGKAFPRRLLFTNVTILIKTATGESMSFYKSVEAEVGPGRESVRLKLSGMNKSATITFTRGAVKQYELQADNFSTALLAPVSTSPLPFEKLVVDGNLKVATSDDKNFAIEGSGKVTARGLSCPVVSSGTIDALSLPFDLKGNLTGSGIESLAAKISLGGETAIVRGSMRGWKEPVVDLTVAFQNFSYDRAISALPPSLHPDLPVIRLSGSMTGTFRMHLDTANPDSLDYSYSGRTDRLEILDLGQEIDINRLRGPFLHNVRIRPGKQTTILLSPANPYFTPYHNIPFSLKSAVMATEDSGFFSHRGFSTRHIRGSLIDNLKAGKVVRGASTISMQLAKNLFLSTERTLSRKLEEALITVALEQNLDKKRIMEIYLNIIEWGDGIYGIGQASHYYFGKSPFELSPVESAFLASIIARPRNWRPDPLPRLGQGWRNYLQVILFKMYQMGGADFEDLLYAGVFESSTDGLSERNWGRP